MTVTDTKTLISESYVGVPSATGDDLDAGPVGYRLVLFPADVPAGQLVLFICSDNTSTCDDGGASTQIPGPKCVEAD